jgi:hypothetical protein
VKIDVAGDLLAPTGMKNCKQTLQGIKKITIVSIMPWLWAGRPGFNSKQGWGIVNCVTFTQFEFLWANNYDLNMYRNYTYLHIVNKLPIV